MVTKEFLYLLLIVLSIPFKYFVNESQACLQIGKALSDVESGRGFQDAISIPASTKITLLIWFLIGVTLFLMVYYYDWTTFGLGLLILFISSLIFGIFLPKTDSTHFKKKILVSLVRRYADYEKENDKVRADAISMLIERFKNRIEL